MPNLSNRIKVKRKYYKSTNPNREPINYQLFTKKGKEQDTFTVVMHEDPILKRKGNERVKKGLENHELNEVNARLHGIPKGKAHAYAVNKEGKATKNIRTHKKFWESMEKKYKLGIKYTT